MTNFLLKTLALLIGLQSTLFAQQPVSYFNKVYGGNDTMNMLTQIVKPLDEGYIIMGGYRTSNYRFLYTAKLDLQGNMQWFKNIDSINTVANDPLDLGVLENGNPVTQLTDKSLIATYYKYGDITVCKIDTTGIINWRRVYEKEDYQVPKQIIETIDGGFAITGTSINFNQDSSWGYLLKLNYLGQFEWDKLYDRGNSVTFFSVQQWWDGTYIMGGWGWNGTDYDMWVVKTTANGDTVWTKALGEAYNDWECNVSIFTTWEDWYFNNAPVTYLVSGVDVVDDNYSRKQYVAKLTEDGDTLIWERKYSNPALFQIASLQTMPIIYPDGSFLGVSGYISDGTDFPDEFFAAAVLMKFRSNGTVEWYKKFYPENTFAEAYLKDLQRTPDGGYVMAGYQYNPSPQKGWVLKLDEEFNTCSFVGCDSTIYTGYPIGLEEIANNNNWSVTPNPSSEQINISPPSGGWGVNSATFVLYNLLGQVVRQVGLGSGTVQVSVLGLPAGTYLYQIINPQKQILQHDKLIVLH